MLLGAPSSVLQRKPYRAPRVWLKWWIPSYGWFAKGSVVTVTFPPPRRWDVFFVPNGWEQAASDRWVGVVTSFHCALRNVQR